LALGDNVLCFDALNEPNLGMIGWHDLSLGFVFLKQVPSPTWFESLQLGDGFEKMVAYYNPSLVLAGKWRQQGAWNVVDGKAVLLKKDHFWW